MADPRTFVLIGNFEDNITPSLERINNSIANLKKTFTGLSTRRGGGYDSITKSVGSLVSSQKHLANAVKEVREEVSKSIPYLAEYRKEVGKAAAANFAFARSTGQAARNESNLWRQATREAEAYKRMATSASSASRSAGGPQRRGGMPMPPPGNPPRGGGGGYGGGYGGYRGSVARDATFAFGQTLGYQLSNTITGSIVQGFQIGVGLMVKPFQYFLDGFSERVKDESTDVQTAGAMFAIAQRKNMDMFENFNQAIRAQQQINYKLAESAAALPGATTEYVQMGKRVLDSMMTVLSKDVKGVSAFAQELDPTLKAGDKQGALATLTQKFTEKAVLLGQGSTYRGNYGVPQLLEQLIGSENVSESMFNKYAMFKDLPIFQSVFKDMQGEIAQTGAYSAERIRKVFQLLDEALPNEVIQAHKNTMSGFLEAMRSAFFDPEVGLFGLGRKIQGMEMAMVDQYGNFVDRQGKIVGSWDKAAKEQISLYESIQKILTGFGLPLAELATYLPKLFEPFNKLITPLQNMFKVAQGFYRNFNIYTKEFENLAKGLSDMGDKKGAATMKKSAGARGTLLAISNLLTTFGDMSEGKFKDISTKLQDPSADIAAISKDVMTSVFNSKFIEQLGFQIGLLVGGVLSTVAQLLGFAKGAGDTRIVSGLKAGFEAAGGTQAFKDIFTSFFQLIFKAVKGIFMMAPAQITALIGASLMLPALMSGISVAIGNFIENLIDANLDDLKKFKPRGKTAYTSPIGPLPAPGLTPSQRLAGKTRNAGPGYLDSGVKPRSGFRGFLKGAVGAGGGPNQSLLGRSAINAAKNPLRAAKGLPVKIVGTAKNAFSAVKGGGLGAVGGGIKNLFGKGMTGLGKVGGIATVGFGIVEALMSLLSGDSLGTALGKGAGPVIGTIIGTALLGPLGGIIGGMIGGLTPITDALGESFRALLGALQGAGSAILTFGGLLGDIIGSIAGMFGGGGDFDGLKAILSPLTLAFQALEVGVKGLALLIQQIRLEYLKRFGTSAEYQEATEERDKLAEELEIAKARADVYNDGIRGAATLEKKLNDMRAEYSSLVSSGDIKRAKSGYLRTYIEAAEKALLGEIKEEVKEKEDKLKTDRYLSAERKAQIKKEIELGKQRIKELESGKPTPTAPGAKPKPTTKPGDINAAITALGGDPNAALNVPKLTTTKPKPKSTLSPMNQAVADFFGGAWKALTTRPSQVGARPDPAGFTATPKANVTETPKNIAEINRRAGEQAKGITQVRKGTEKTTAAVKELTAKITAQTSVQTTVAAIYNLLASGALRVNGMPMNFPGNWGGGGGGLPPQPGVNQNPLPYNPFLNPGGIIAPQPNAGLTLPSISSTYPTTLGETQVASLYTPSAGGGATGGTFGDINVNVAAGNVNDPKELAYLVAMEISDAVQTAQAANLGYIG